MRGARVGGYDHGVVLSGRAFLHCLPREQTQRSNHRNRSKSDLCTEKRWRPILIAVCTRSTASPEQVDRLDVLCQVHGYHTTNAAL